MDQTSNRAGGAAVPGQVGVAKISIAEMALAFVLLVLVASISVSFL
ncbi:MAG TPA: hypothetical protein VL068_01370 [Microthrixaceae bacterium]|nr:hypothetical protein [Microthrixaceae bacterium]